MGEFIRVVAEHPLAACGVGLWVVVFANAVIETSVRAFARATEKVVVAIYASRMTNTQITAAAAAKRAMAALDEVDDAPR